VEKAEAKFQYGLPNPVPDDEKLYFGGDEDYSFRWDEAVGELRVRNEPAGNTVLRFWDNNLRIEPGGNLHIGMDYNENKMWVATRFYDLAEHKAKLRMKDDQLLTFGTYDDITFQYDSANAKLKVGGADFVDETADGMTADPEADTEDGFLKIRIGTTNYQIPIYLA